MAKSLARYKLTARSIFGGIFNF